VKKAIIALLWGACAAAPATAAAQSVSTSDPLWQISLLAGVTEPRGDFMEKLATDAWLVTVDVLRGVKNLPVFIGFSGGGGDYGSRKRRVSLNDLIPEAQAGLDVETTHSIYLAGAAPAAAARTRPPLRRRCRRVQRVEHRHDGHGSGTLRGDVQGLVGSDVLQRETLRRDLQHQQSE